MANTSLVFISFGLFITSFLSLSCKSQIIELPQDKQQHEFIAKSKCQIQQLTARASNLRLESEAGFTDCWDSNNEDFECAGIQFVRHTIQPKGLLLPYYASAPQLVYVIQGSGVQGTVFPGCAETYESEERGDRHQKLRRFHQGDILALPHGITHWVYNDGQAPIVIVSFLHAANQHNQLESKFRKFFLAGKPRSTQSQQGQKRQEEHGKRNIFSGFDEELLAEAFKTEPEVVRKLQSRDDNRGTIIRAEKLHLVLPEYSREEYEHEREGRNVNHNGLEETFCSLKIRENIDNPSKADAYNPRGGRISTLNSLNLPILSYLRLNAERGVLYKNALVAPFWNTNAHSITYVTKGNARVQVVNHQGQSVFDGELSEGQLLIVPQNFAVLKKASNQGFEYVSFKTNDDAVKSQLAGRLSVISALPLDVLVNAYGISREQARNLKFSREEATVFSASGSSARRGRQDE